MNGTSSQPTIDGPQRKFEMPNALNFQISEQKISEIENDRMVVRNIKTWLWLTRVRKIYKLLVKTSYSIEMDILVIKIDAFRSIG